MSKFYHNTMFEVGIVVNTQGARGDVRLLPSTDDPRRFDLLDHVFLEKPGQPQKRFDIERVWYHRGFVVLKLAGIDDMTAGEALKKSVVKIEPELALPLSDDEYYIRDLIGMTVVTETGDELGVIKDVISTGANDVYSVTTAARRELLLPAIKECILSVDIPGRVMTVHLMDGLL